MVKSQNDDIGIINEELSKAISDVETIKNQLEFCKLLAEKQAEEIALLNKRKAALKRTRIFDISACGTGLFLGVLGYVLKQDEATKNLGTAFFYTGIGITSAAGISIAFTIPF